MRKGIVQRQAEEKCFSGTFTPFWRQRFHEHRRKLGVGYRQLGRILGVSGETVRKWEAGYSRCCHLAQRGRVWDFLMNRYDGKLRSLVVSRNPVHRRIRKLPLPLQQCFAKAWMVYAVALGYPREGRWFLAQLQRFLTKTEKKLSPDPEKNEAPTPR